jgi:hypothetical protein
VGEFVMFRGAVVSPPMAARAPAAMQRRPGRGPAIADADRTARRFAFTSMAVSALLACSNVAVGLVAHSTSALATGLAFAIIQLRGR